MWELYFENVEQPEKEIFSSQAKFNTSYRKRKGIVTRKAKFDAEMEQKITNVAKKTYKNLNLNGYARIDMRVTSSGDVYVLEANPNPDIALDDEFACSAKHIGLKYPQLIEKILKLSLAWAKKA